jgi:DNA helicase-2/ATP-dependent DNA helicase PcrA
MVDLEILNTEQRNAVTSHSGPLMILAGAGTGKTRVITYRIAHMISKGVNPSSIVALSFTNKAAKEMIERVRSIIGTHAQKVWMGTFHSFCLHLLRKHGSKIGLSADFSLVDTADQIELVRRSLDEKGWAGLYKADQLHAQISKAKNHLLSSEDILLGHGENVLHGDRAIIGTIFQLYERQLKLNRVIDFDDCIYKTVELLRENSDVQDWCHRNFNYFMVDEFQDTNLAQLKILELVVSKRHNVCVVGDDDQSIYSWRGAMYEVLERFEALFPNTVITKLEQNYRCTNVILSAANNVIKNNKKRKDKTLWSSSTEQIPINLKICDGDQDEAQHIVEKCLSLLGSGLEPRDIAILYRANTQSRSLELALKEARIPCKTYGGQSFFERKEIKDFLCYFRLILNSTDRLALWRVINTPHRGIGIKTLEKIESLAISEKKSPYLILQSMDYKNVTEFYLLIEKLRNLPRESPSDIYELCHEIIKATGLETEIKLKNDNISSRDRKLQNLRSMPQWLRSLASHVITESGKFDPQKILDILTLDGDRFESNEKERSNTISLMTIHAAKGLEFPAVFLVGLEEELLPHKNSITDPLSICEERRLFYVALTRAKTKLFLSYCQERVSGYQGKISRIPSRFIKELPEACLSEQQVTIGKELSKENHKKIISDKLSTLRESLKKNRVTPLTKLI